MLVKSIYVYPLSHFQTHHFISGWKPVYGSKHLFVFVVLDEGVTGIGEGTPYHTSIVSDYELAMKISKKLIQLDVGEALNNLKSLEYKLFEKKANISFGAFLAFESALLDALAKARKSSVADVLGGVYRMIIPVAGTVFLDHPLGMVERVRWWLDRGVNHVKLKIPCSLNMLELYLDTITRRTWLKDEGVTLRVDANECFKGLDKAYKALQIMVRYGVDIVEQPMPRDKLREMAKLRKAFSPTIKIMLDESLTRPQDLETFASMEVADIANFHPSKLGCLSITREVILKAKKLGLKVNIGSALMTEVGLAHYLNLAASLPELDYPLEEIGIKEFYPQYSILRSRKEELLKIVNGSIKLPTGPGISLEFSDLDFDLLKIYTASVKFKDTIRTKFLKTLNIVKNNLKSFR